MPDRLGCFDCARYLFDLSRPEPYCELNRKDDFSRNAGDRCAAFDRYCPPRVVFDNAHEGQQAG